CVRQSHECPPSAYVALRRRLSIRHRDFASRLRAAVRPDRALCFSVRHPRHPVPRRARSDGERRRVSVRLEYRATAVPRRRGRARRVATLPCPRDVAREQECALRAPPRDEVAVAEPEEWEMSVVKAAVQWGKSVLADYNSTRRYRKK